MHNVEYTCAFGALKERSVRALVRLTGWSIAHSVTLSLLLPLYLKKKKHKRKRQKKKKKNNPTQPLFPPSCPLLCSSLSSLLSLPIKTNPTQPDPSTLPPPPSRLLKITAFWAKDPNWFFIYFALGKIRRILGNNLPTPCHCRSAGDSATTKPPHPTR